MTKQAKPPNVVPPLPQARRLAMQDALDRRFRNGRTNVADRDGTNFWGFLHAEAMYAALAAYEFADPEGPFASKQRLLAESIAALEAVTSEFQPSGIVGDGDMNSPYFALVPLTRALRDLKGSSDAAWHGKMVDRCVKLFADAAANINRTHDYLNPRGLEAVGAFGLHRLTGDRKYLDRCEECVDQLLTRIYPCGAQPYHTGQWVWGRRPAQAYQFLTASLMLYLGKELNRPDAVDYVRRIMDYSLIATDRRGHAFVAIFEGLHKVRSGACAGRQWPIAAALGDERFAALAATTYGIWARGALDFDQVKTSDGSYGMHRAGYLVALNDALHLGVKRVPEAGQFAPKPGRFVLNDISTVFVHENDLDVAMTLLTGYSAFAEADCGNVKLFALTPELTETPIYRNAGTDALRVDWKIPSEQIEWRRQDGKTILKGRVYTKWATHKEKDFARLHNRLLEVTMTYGDGELILEYETIENTQPEPMASRLLFLLSVRPLSASPSLKIAGTGYTPPPADAEEEFRIETPVNAVRFAAPDGSAIEIVPEVSTADRIVAERPPRHDVPLLKQGRESKKRISVRPANEGCLRLAFEGLDALDRGRYRIRFLPAK